jgi:hypothetical protein
MHVGFNAVSGLGAAARPETQRQSQSQDFDVLVDLALADNGVSPSGPQGGPEVNVPSEDQPLLQDPGQGVGAEFQMNDGSLIGKTSGMADGNSGMSGGSELTNTPPQVGELPEDGPTNGGNKVNIPNVNNQLPKVAGPTAPPAAKDRGIGVDGSGLSNKLPDVPETGAVRLPTRAFDVGNTSATNLAMLLALQEHDG